MSPAPQNPFSVVKGPYGAPAKGAPRKPVVLLVHGASAASRTFHEPAPGLVGYLDGRLGSKGSPTPFEVYTLDWRSSMLTADGLVTRAKPEEDKALFTLDAAVGDLRAAIDEVHARTHVAPEDIRVVGHCIGGALLAQTIALGGFLPKHVVLTTLGLFFKVGVEGWIKGNDFVLEDLFADVAKPDPSKPYNPLAGRVISANVATNDAQYAWPGPLEDRYRFWLDSGLHHGCGNPFCERVCFMYGMPFRVKDMLELHDREGGLAEQFGSMPLGIYAHCLRNLRRGWAAPYDGEDETTLVGKEARTEFDGRSITLITGNENQVWHRNSIDVMYEWLTNAPKLRAARVSKHVLKSYGHQDLYWSRYAIRDVYPLIARGLGAETA
jgi:pimeloyl-ACP methyl ester carboxylesterase